MLYYIKIVLKRPFYAGVSSGVSVGGVSSTGGVSSIVVSSKGDSGSALAPYLPA